MKRRILIALLGLACLVLLALVVVGVLLATLNPNDYKKEIAEAVQKATGRNLIFEGDLTTSFFPSLGLKTGRLRLEDPPGFGQDPFMSVESASFSLALGPLFTGEARVEEVALRGVSLKLVRASDGTVNWETGFAKPAEEGVRTLEEAPQASKPSGKNLDLRVDDLRCGDITVTYRDLRAGSSYRVRVHDLTMENVRRDTDIPVTLTGSLADEASGAKADISLSALLRLESSGDARLDLKKFEIAAENRARQSLTFSLAGEARYTAQSNTLVMEKLKGALAGTAYEAGFTVLPAGAEGTAPGVTHDVRGTVRLGKVDLDALLPVVESFAPPEKSGDGAPPVAAPPAASRASGAASGGSAPGLYADVQIAVEGLSVAKLLLTNISVRMVVDKGAVTAAPFSFHLYEGTMEGNAGCDLRAAPPGVHLAAVGRGVRVEPLLRALAETSNLSGVADLDVNVQGKGLAWAEIAPTLQGSAKVAVTNGEVRGFTLIPADLPGIRPVPAEFPLERFSASWVGSKGVFTSRDILMLSPVVKAQGGGTVDLGRSSMALAVDFLMGGVPPAIPFRVSGPFSSPHYGVDMEAFLKNTATGVLRAPEKAGELLKGAPDKAGSVVKEVEGLFR